ncbi:hypothetical protein HanIR_Chr17g0863061 [Helianthus annuus]|nr:hypothetical protein HanIR_Chr17g0863061 [Helianthus annuus]
MPAMMVAVVGMMVGQWWGWWGTLYKFSVPSPKGNNDVYGCDLDRIGLVVNDLIMWNNVAKSTLWFGFGSLCFISSCFTTGVSLTSSVVG